MDEERQVPVLAFADHIMGSEYSNQPRKDALIVERESRNSGRQPLQTKLGSQWKREQPVKK